MTKFNIRTMQNETPRCPRKFSLTNVVLGSRAALKSAASQLNSHSSFGFVPFAIRSNEILDLPDTRPSHERIANGAWLLRGFALGNVTALLAEIEHIKMAAVFRHLEIPGGFRMSVAMTNCGTLGWVSDRRGYRYTTEDPLSGQPWPPMPALFSALAERAARAAGFEGFVPDACLVNRYAPGARLTLHQDKDESDFRAPIVSVSLGLPAVFLFGGNARKDKQRRIPLQHGDVVVWGAPARLNHHGVLALKDGHHPCRGGNA